ncbi:MAG: SCP2 sterol-binding domain-containing protein [Desulfobacteraceae bacterium]|nr:SCP2 sterol-binding domain-containing protein [Desulfobacteraceae bacterium]MBC2756346.1 SCP2 sterol-binding domain-containing protein [Desulfobacteraceae bacterium]
MALTEVRQIIEKFNRDFDPEAAKGVKGVIQYHISGDDGGDWNITINDGTFKIEEGIHDSPNVTLKMTGKTWLGLVNKTVNPMVAFTTGRLRVTGDRALAQRVPAIFRV